MLALLPARSGAQVYMSSASEGVEVSWTTSTDGNGSVSQSNPWAGTASTTGSDPNDFAGGTAQAHATVSGDSLSISGTATASEGPESAPWPSDPVETFSASALSTASASFSDEYNVVSASLPAGSPVAISVYINTESDGNTEVQGTFDYDTEITPTLFTDNMTVGSTVAVSGSAQNYDSVSIPYFDPEQGAEITAQTVPYDGAVYISWTVETPGVSLVEVTTPAPPVLPIFAMGMGLMGIRMRARRRITSRTNRGCEPAE